MCPPDRQALRDFYDSAKGSEWTERTNWLDEYKDPCDDWYGVTCRNGVITELKLHTNGLSGRLSKRIGKLKSLEIIDLSNNDIKVRYSHSYLHYLCL